MEPVMISARNDQARDNGDRKAFYTAVRNGTNG